jgi:hypothetical protein
MSGDRFNCVLKNTYGTLTTANVTLTVTPLPASITRSPSNQTVNAGNNTTFAVAVVGVPAPALQWQISTNGGTTWSNLTASATFSGVTNTTLAVTNATAAMSGDQFQCVAANAGGSGTSASAVLNVNFPPAFTLQPVSTQALETANANFTVAASGFPAPSFQWQLSTDGGNTWSNLTDTGIFSGSATASLTLGSVTNDASGDQFRCIASNSLGSVTSSAATFTVTPAAPAIQDNDAISIFAYVGYAQNVYVTATGTPTPAYQWQLSTNGGSTWSNLSDDNVNYSGTTTDILSLLNPALSMANYEFRCIVTNSLGTATTSPMTLTVLTGTPTRRNPL